MKTIALILGTNRKTALGDRLLKQISKVAPTIATKYQVQFTEIKIADYDLPLFQDPIAPLDDPDRQPTGAVKRFLDDLNQADGYLFLTPEYNHAIPGALKNALDYVANEPLNKATKIATYSEGLRGAQLAGLELVPILQTQGFFVLPKLTMFSKLDATLDENGNYFPDAKTRQARYESRIESMLREISFYTNLLTDNPLQ